MSAVTITVDSSEPLGVADARVKRRAYAVAIVLHVVVLMGLVQIQRSRSVHMGRDGPLQNGIEAFVVPSERPAAATSVPKPEPKKTNRVISAAEQPQSGPSVDAAASQESAPVRLGPGDSIRLLNKVEPVYPVIMRTARMEGTVVLDAVIHRDGTIGDITVVKSSASAFERAAIDAVKQWRYTPLPYEGILTVTLNFTMRT